METVGCRSEIRVVGLGINQFPALNLTRFEIDSLPLLLKRPLDGDGHGLINRKNSAPFVTGSGSWYRLLKRFAVLVTGFHVTGGDNEAATSSL